MKHLCFGGSFNPIHNAHLQCAQTAAEKLGYEQVVLIPSAQPPHKPGDADLAPAEHRLGMVRAAVEGSKLFIVNDLELHRDGPSYTLITARQLKAEGWPEVHWLIGADMLNDLPHWHQAEQLLKEVHFVVMARPGCVLAWDRLPPAFQVLRRNVVQVPQLDISATDIRRRVREGLPIDHLVPPAVARYIAEHGLYQAR